MRRQLPPLALEVRQLRDLLPVEEASASVQELPIRVYCRFRAQNDSEEFRGGQEVWEHTGAPIPNTVNVAPSTAATLGPVPEYTFDRVFGPEASQDDVYAEILPVVQEVLEDGGNGSILCYGQTSAGKTFTIEGEEEDRRGILPRALETVFAALSPLSLKDVSIHVSMLEIYMERLRDLLVDGIDLSVAEDRHQGVVVRGLQEVPVQTLQHAMEVWHHGRQQRITAATGMNDRSSRSHCIFTLHVVRDGVASKLSIVDLAGSECVKKIYVPGKSNAANKETAEEAKAINQSLSTLGLVINRLAKSKGRNVDSHVPYRSSKLTRVLQDSLGGGSRTVLLLNCSISSLQVAETLSTLRFGTRARSCVNVAATGNCEEPMLLKTLRLARQELQRLQARVWPREADDEDDTPFSGLSALSHEQESVSIVEFNSPESGAHRPRFVQHGLELSLVQEAEGSEENEEIPCPRLSIASGFRRSTCSRRTSRRLSCHSRQSVVAACSNPASLPTSPRWHQGLYFSSVSFCGVDGQTECWEHPLTKSEKRSRLISILAKELSGADTELKDVQALANDLQRRCDALQAETEWLGAERDAAMKSGSGENPYECKPSGFGPHVEQSCEEEASTKVKTEDRTEAITDLERLQELEQLRLEKQRLQTETRNLEADKEHLVLESNELSRRVQSVEERLQAMTAESCKMEETSGELQQKNEKLNAQLERETARAEKAEAQCNELANQSHKTLSELEHAKQQLQGENKQTQAITDLERLQELEQLRLEKQRLQTETRNLEADKEHLVLESNELSRRVQSVEERLQAMTAESRKMEETSEELQQKNEKLNARLERETARAEKELEQLRLEKQRLQTETRNLEADKEHLVLESNELSRRVQSVEERLQAMTAESRKMEETSEELQQKNEKLNARLERETARAEKAEAQCNELANQSHKTLSELEHAKQQLQGENKQTQASQRMLQLNAHDRTKIEGSMEERIQHLCSERDQLRASSSSLALELQQALNAVKNLERLKKFHETEGQEHGRQPEAENKLHSRSTKSTEGTRIPFRVSGKCVWTVLLLLHTVWVLQAGEKNRVATYGLGEDPGNLSISSRGDGFSVRVPFGHGVEDVEETAKFTESSEKEGSIEEMVEMPPSIFDDEDREDQQHDTSLQEQLILSVNKEPTLPRITRPQATQEKDTVAWSALPVLTAFASLVFGYAG